MEFNYFIYKTHFLCYNTKYKKDKGFIMIADTPTKIRTNVYLDADMRTQAKKVFKRYGVSLSDAINIFLTQSVLEKGLPFEMKIPNDETKQAIEDARANIGIEQIDYSTHIEEMKKCISN